MRTSGFSLIELLVVVAIIGILGGVGIVGYQAYISQTQDATTKDNFEFLKRTLDQGIAGANEQSNHFAALPLDTADHAGSNEQKHTYILRVLHPERAAKIIALA